MLEISDRVKVANEEVDMMKVRMKDAQEHEQKSIAEAEKSKTELEIAVKSHEDAAADGEGHDDPTTRAAGYAQ